MSFDEKLKFLIKICDDYDNNSSLYYHKSFLFHISSYKKPILVHLSEVSDGGKIFLRWYRNGYVLNLEEILPYLDDKIREQVLFNLDLLQD